MTSIPQSTVTDQPFRAAMLQPALTDALKALHGFKPGKYAPDVLKGVYMRSDDRALILATTDLELMQMVRVPARIDVPGAICVSYDTLHDLVPLLSKGDRIDLDWIPDYQSRLGRTVSVGFNDPRIRMACGTNASYLKPLAAADFPHLPRIHQRDLLEKLELSDLEPRAMSIGSVKAKEGEIGVGDQRFRINVGAFYRAFTNLKRYEKAADCVGDYPAFIGFHDGRLWLVCHDYAAFITAELVGIAVETVVTEPISINA